MINQKLDLNNIPQHIAIIMDGNRRWAKKRLMPAFMGHEFGRRQLEPIIRESAKLGIKYLTFWAFSTENWKRPEEEKEAIFNILRQYGKKVLTDLQKNGVRLNIIGEIEKFPEDIQEILYKTIQSTVKNDTIVVNLALSYGGRSEILRAVKKVIKEKIKPDELNEEVFANFTDTPGQPDPEMIIRTGGVSRTSGFLPWQTGYSELYFTDVLWPDFDGKQLQKAIIWYQTQQRNFGK